MSRSARRSVLLALALVVVLVGSLALRRLNAPVVPAPRAEPAPAADLRWVGPRPGGRVPAPRAVDLADLAHPDWSPAKVRFDRRVRFGVDLDLIAPLGDGPENAALWFGDFARHDGARRDALQAASERRDRAVSDGTLDPELQRLLQGNRRVLLPDDALVIEAEPWVDQATMRFYPDVWAFEGHATSIPNLLMAIQLARTWVLRGDMADDPEVAMADYRRAIRLGRLLRQEDAVIITDLVGLGCIEDGLQALYSRLLREGRTDEALVAALALGEIPSQRSVSSERFTEVTADRVLRRGWVGVRVDVDDDRLKRLMTVAEKGPDRRFRIEAMLTLNLVRFHGSRGQREETAALLDRLAAAAEGVEADAAAFARDVKPDLRHFEDQAVDG